jgi:hypothetical protein
MEVKRGVFYRYYRGGFTYFGISQTKKSGSPINGTAVREQLAKLLSMPDASYLRAHNNSTSHPIVGLFWWRTQGKQRVPTGTRKLEFDGEEVAVKAGDFFIDLGENPKGTVQEPFMIIEVPEKGGAKIDDEIDIEDEDVDEGGEGDDDIEEDVEEEDGDDDIEEDEPEPEPEPELTLGHWQAEAQKLLPGIKPLVNVPAEFLINGVASALMLERVVRDNEALRLLLSAEIEETRLLREDIRELMEGLK